jgi:hypothetical protein
MEQTQFKSPFPDGTPIEEFHFHTNLMPLAFLLQVNLSGGAQHMKMLDKELHEALSKVGFNLTWELSPGSGEVGVAGFVFKRLAAGTSTFAFILETSNIINTTQCLTLAVVS